MHGIHASLSIAVIPRLPSEIRMENGIFHRLEMKIIDSEMLKYYSMCYCDGTLPSVPRLLLGLVFLAGLHFSLGTQSHMTTIFNHTLAKGRKKKLHLWEAQICVASGVEAGVIAFNGRLE